MRVALSRHDRCAAASVCLLLIVAAGGCRPTTFYRQQADADAYCMVDQKSARVGVAPGEYRIEIDPRSRMFDPNDPDCEPMPPDDPTSNQLMQCVDCKKGSKCWKCLPKTPFVENPAWFEYLPRDENGQLVLDLEGAVQTALIHSPDYQSQLEELYLSALDVTFERFRFDAQFFGGSGVLFEADGELNSGTTRTVGGTTSRIPTSTLTTGSTGLEIRKLNAVGGECIVGFANSLMWQLSGPNNYSSNTLLDFSLIQPLLRRGGRTRVLERLTISERSLLANVRQMERYRRGFYQNIYTGDGPGAGPSRRGGFFGAAGLEGFSGVGGGGFGRVGGGGGFGGNVGVTGGAGAQGAGGYLGLLQNSQVLRNQRANVGALRDSVLQLEASNDAGRIDRFQVDLARQALYTAQSQLLSAENQFQNSLENYVITLGLPPELDVKLSDAMLDRLNLLDPDLEELQEVVADALLSLRELREAQAAATEDDAAQAPLLVPPNPEEAAVIDRELRDTLTDYLAALGEVRAVAEERLAAVQDDFRILDEAVPTRRKNLRRLSSRSEVREANIDPTLFSAEQFEARVAKSKAELQALEIRLTQTLDEMDALATQTDAPADQTLNRLIDTLSTFSSELLELKLAQASARLEAIDFEPVDLSAEQALAIASNYRRDWMNARANLVDSWRLIYFNANDLLSDLDLVFSGDLGNVGDNPFRFRDSRGSLRVGLEFDAPLTRLAERNVYRQSLIEYQQARRSYYQFRDRVYQGLRNTIRQIRLNEINLELRRAAVQVAISQVDLTQLRLFEPPQPGETTQLSNTTSRDLVQSLSDLLNVQNDFLSVWVNYGVQRLGLEFDLGVMELAPNGLRLENDIPLETYLVDLPLNSGDLGPIVMEKLQFQQVNTAQPESVRPAPSPDVEGPDEAEPLPTPPAESSNDDPQAGDIQLTSFTEPMAPAKTQGQTELPTALPPVEE